MANTLVYNKVYFESGNDQLILSPFPYYLELFFSSMRILSEIKLLIPQEPIPSDKFNLIDNQNAIPFHSTFSTSSTKDNSSELLSLLEMLLCFIIRTSIDDGELFLNEFIDQWVQLSSLKDNSRFKIILSYGLQLKHIVSLYEVIEGQVANIMIQFVDKKFNESLTSEMEKDLDEAIDFDGKKKEKIPADSFMIAMTRFIQRVLQIENDKEDHSLSTYLTDISLNLWPNNSVSEEILDDIFPGTPKVANSLAVYDYISQKIKVRICSKEKKTNNACTYF